jgi:hypothetical protein
LKEREHEKSGDEPSLKQRKCGNGNGTVLYCIEHESEHLSAGISGISAQSIGGDYLPENGFGLFYLGKLGRLMRCVYIYPFLVADHSMFSVLYLFIRM